MIGGTNMNKKVLMLNKNDKIVIINSDNKGVIVKNKNNKIIVEETVEKHCDNLYIKSLSYTEITSFILTNLLENNKDKHIVKDAITKLQEDYYNYICGKNNESEDVRDMFFQVITYYEKE